jgi:hypothetical protein
VELSISTLCQEQKQAQTSDLVALGQVGRENSSGKLVEGLKLLDVAGESFGVAGADGE